MQQQDLNCTIQVQRALEHAALSAYDAHAELLRRMVPSSVRNAGMVLLFMALASASDAAPRW